jgi:hypothetical protein
MSRDKLERDVHFGGIFERPATDVHRYSVSVIASARVSNALHVFPPYLGPYGDL